MENTAQPSGEREQKGEDQPQREVRPAVRRKRLCAFDFNVGAG
jgi:hypothetical protein